MSKTKKLSEKFRAKYPKLFIILICLICFLSPYILINFIIFIMKQIFNISIGIPDLWVLTHGYEIDLKDYLTFFIGLVQVVVNGFFSYFLWETALKSNELSEQIKENENNKDKNILRENALIVYYDLMLGISDLVKLYNTIIKMTKTTAPKRLYFSNEWIKNTAMLQEFLSYNDLNSIYTLYGDLHTIKELLEEDNSDLNDEIKRVFTNVISENVLDYVGVINLTDFDKIEYLLNNYYLCVLEKLKQLILSKTEIEIIDNKDETFSILSSDKKPIYCGSMNGYTYSGEGVLYNEYCKERFNGCFENGIFKNGLRKEYYKNGELFYEIRYENGKRVEGTIYSEENSVIYAKGKFQGSILYEGYWKKYKPNGDLLYEGDMLAGKYNGLGTSYYDNKNRKQGKWRLGEFIEGIEYNRRISDSDGYDYYAEQNWIEEQIERNNDDDYQRRVQESLEQNATKWTEYGDMEWENGSCKLIRGTTRKDYDY